MKYLLHSIPVKVLAVIVASLCLLISILSITATIDNRGWVFEAEDNWFESEGMNRHNEQVINSISFEMERAIALEKDNIDVPQLIAKDLDHTNDYFLNPEHYGFTEGSSERDYLSNVNSTALYTRQYAVSDGERILYHSPEIKMADLGDDAGPAGLMAAFKRLSSKDPILLDTATNIFNVADLSVQGERTYLYSELADSDVRFFIYLPAVSATNVDGFFGYETLYNHMSPYRTLLLQIATFSTLLFILLLTFLWVGAGYRRRADGSYTVRGEITLSWMDRVPFELMVVAIATGIGLLIALAVEITYFVNVRFPDDLFNFRLDFSYISSLIGPLWLSLLALWVAIIGAAVFLLSLIRRLKAKSFWRYSLVGYMVVGIKRGWRWLWQQVDGKPLMLFILIPYLFLVFLFIAFFSYGRYDGFASFISFLIGLVIFVALPLLVIAHLIYLKQSSVKVTEFSLALAEGNDAEAIPIDKLHPDFRPLEQNLRKLEQGLEQAVSKQLQADRLKTDLITNVSHDLKTPLTSIINYIDLLKREGLDGANASSYLETLDQKANRLKQLTEDLVEASKASSGNLSVEREWLDLIELMRQVSGEFEDKMKHQRLSLIMRLPETMQRYMIWSDGRHIWRIMENLMENAGKYALPGSRVYLSLRLLNDAWVLEVKNISAMQIDLSTSDLMERFVRGDSARSSEGSGLGLSIASSLAGLLGGRMVLDVKDDVFTATVTLPFVNAPYPAATEDSAESGATRQEHESSYYADADAEADSKAYSDAAETT